MIVKDFVSLCSHMCVWCTTCWCGWRCVGISDEDVLDVTSHWKTWVCTRLSCFSQQVSCQQSRVYASLKRVDDVIDLKVCDTCSSLFLQR